MAYLTGDQLIAAAKQLDAARKKFHCDVSRTDANGATVRREAKRKGTFVEVPLGAHGANYIRIDPATGEVRCGACHDGDDATVR